MCLTWHLLPFINGAACAGAALAGPGHKPGEGHGRGAEETAYGRPGDPKQPSRPGNVAMREADGKMLFVPDQVEVCRGKQIQFILRNNGEVDHEFVVATLDENLKHAEEMRKNPEMEHDDPNANRLAPKKTGKIIWQFTKAGEFDFSCLIPGHRKAGMFGKVLVK